MPFPRGVHLAVAALGFAGASCASSPARPDSGSNPAGTVTVFAAASLTSVFSEIGEAFMMEHPDVEVVLSFAASSELVNQINEGAPADVFASADQSNMTKLGAARGTVADPVVFATNRLEIIVARGNPERISGLADLADPDLIVVTCAPQVPCGSYAAEVLARSAVVVTPKSLESNVRAVVTKVTLGEADAGIVYATDVIAAGDGAAGVEIPADENVVAEYQISVVDGATNPAAAKAFVDFVAGPRGKSILSSYGFSAP